MIFFDGIHIVSDESLSELHSFAQRMGLKREWFQDGYRCRHPHYDATTAHMRNKIERSEEAVLVTKRGTTLACMILRTGGGCESTRKDILSEHLREVS